MFVAKAIITDDSSGLPAVLNSNFMAFKVVFKAYKFTNYQTFKVFKAID